MGRYVSICGELVRVEENEEEFEWNGRKEDLLLDFAGIGDGTMGNSSVGIRIHLQKVLLTK